MYADDITESMQRTIDETDRRRAKQLAYNETHGIVPRAIVKSMDTILEQTSMVDNRQNNAYAEKTEKSVAADPVVQYMSADAIRRAIDKNKKDMMAAAKELDFIEAARLRDENKELEKLLQNKAG
jgi:excinuclease ABC subunit B